MYGDTNPVTEALPGDELTTWQPLVAQALLVSDEVLLNAQFGNADTVGTSSCTPIKTRTKRAANKRINMVA